MREKLLFITSVPSFYKNLLFTTLLKFAEVKVFYTYRSPIKREKDFFKHFDETYVVAGPSESYWEKTLKLRKAVSAADYVFYNGWDDIFFWQTIMFTSKRKNILMLESSINEFSDATIKNRILNGAKKIFVNRLSCCIASGTPHSELMEKLDYKDKISCAYGVGLLDFEYESLSKYEKTATAKNFIFIGRYSSEKGVDLLVEIFKKNTDINLHLVGDIDNSTGVGYSNIIIHGYVNRSEIKNLFEKSDVLILPSRSEPWGLVVEEALYHGLPVIVSSAVGCARDLVQAKNVGIVFESGNVKELGNAVHQMTDSRTYQYYARKVDLIDFHAMRNHYIHTVLTHCSS